MLAVKHAAASRAPSPERGADAARAGFFRSAPLTSPARASERRREPTAEAGASPPVSEASTTDASGAASTRTAAIPASMAADRWLFATREDFILRAPSESVRFLLESCKNGTRPRAGQAP